MRRFFVFIFFTALLLIGHTGYAQHTITDLAGHWETTDGNTGNVTFVEGSKVVASINGLQFPPTPYTVDFSKDPIWFDVGIMPGKTVKGLLQFMDDNTIKWQIFLDGGRGLDFNESDSNPVYVLTRKK
jgi:hypothetical protein